MNVHTTGMLKKTTVIVALALALAASSATATPPPKIYAGVAREAAIETAKVGIIELAIAFGASPSEAARLRRALDKVTPRASRSSCKKIRAWKIVWPDSTPVYVNRKGIVMACYITIAHD